MIHSHLNQTFKAIQPKLFVILREGEKFGNATFYLFCLSSDHAKTWHINRCRPDNFQWKRSADPQVDFQ